MEAVALAAASFFRKTYNVINERFKTLSKRNTTELFKFDIPEGKCYEHYRQFGKTYLSGEASMKSAPTFIQGLLDAGNFASSDKVFFMITDDKSF